MHPAEHAPRKSHIAAKALKTACFCGSWETTTGMLALEQRPSVPVSRLPGSLLSTRRLPRMPCIQCSVSCLPLLLQLPCAAVAIMQVLLVPHFQASIAMPETLNSLDSHALSLLDKCPVCRLAPCDAGREAEGIRQGAQGSQRVQQRQAATTGSSQQARVPGATTPRGASARTVGAQTVAGVQPWLCSTCCEQLTTPCTCSWVGLPSHKACRPQQLGPSV